MQTLDQIYLGVVERWSPRDTSPQPQDRELLEKALIFYELFAQKNAGNMQARTETARAYLRTGIWSMHFLRSPVTGRNWGAAMPASAPYWKTIAASTGRFRVIARPFHIGKS